MCWFPWIFFERCSFSYKCSLFFDFFLLKVLISFIIITETNQNKWNLELVIKAGMLFTIKLSILIYSLLNKLSFVHFPLNCQRQQYHAPWAPQHLTMSFFVHSFNQFSASPKLLVVIFCVGFHWFSLYILNFHLNWQCQQYHAPWAPQHLTMFFLSIYFVNFQRRQNCWLLYFVLIFLHFHKTFVHFQKQKWSKTEWRRMKGSS